MCRLVWPHISPEMRMCLKVRYFPPGRLGQAQPVRDLLLAAALHYHVALLEMVREVLRHVEDNPLGALVHEVRLGQDPWARGKEGEGQIPSGWRTRDMLRSPPLTTTQTDNGQSPVSHLKSS